MSWDIRDRYLWLGFGAVLFLAVKGISSTLRTTIKLSEIYDPDHAKAANDTQAEDSISLDALSTLVTSPNQDISHSATSLILSRFTQDQSACTSLTTDLFSSSATTRRKAKQVLFLFDTLLLELYPLDDTSVSSLHDKSNPTVQIMCRAYLRASRKYRQGRLSSLVEIAEAVEESMRVGQGVHRVHRRPESHFVFPGQEDEEVAVRFQPVSQRVESLVDLLAEQAVTARPMVRFASPSPSSSGDALSEMPALEEVDTNGDVTSVARARRHSQSNHEAEARRRRREAMVLHEGSGAIGREDIIHPRTDSSRS